MKQNSRINKWSTKYFTFLFNRIFHCLQNTSNSTFFFNQNCQVQMNWISGINGNHKTSSTVTKNQPSIYTFNKKPAVRHLPLSVKMIKHIENVVFFLFFDDVLNISSFFHHSPSAVNHHIIFIYIYFASKSRKSVLIINKCRAEIKEWNEWPVFFFIRFAIWDFVKFPHMRCFRNDHPIWSKILKYSFCTNVM